MPNSIPAIKIKPGKILLILLAGIALLVCLSIWGQRIRFFGVADIRGAWHEYLIDLLMQDFYLDAEGNIATYINSLLLFIPALLLAVISAWKKSIKDKFKFHWIGLALIFFFLSMDEAAVLHESLIKPMRAIVGAEGFFYFAWIIPGMVMVTVFGLVYLMFFLHLDRKFKFLFFASLAVYMGGVLGGEMVSGYFAASLGQKNFTYAVAASLEESLELIGASLVTYSLLKYLEHYLPEGIIFKAS